MMRRLTRPLPTSTAVGLHFLLNGRRFATSSSSSSSAAITYETAPEPWRIIPASLPSSPVTEPPAATVAACLGIESCDLAMARHPPLIASSGLPFVLAELTSLEALGRSRGVPAAFEQLVRHAPLAPPKILAYVRTAATSSTSAVSGGEEKADHDDDIHDEIHIRCRMHHGNGSEDAATGSAACALMGLLAHLDGPQRPLSTTLPLMLSARITQGVEMGQPNVMFGSAEWQGSQLLPGGGWADGGLTGAVGAVRIGGHCVPVSRGELGCIGERSNHARSKNNAVN